MSFVRPLNNNGISEGAVLLILPNFLLDNALESFRIHSEDVSTI